MAARQVSQRAHRIVTKANKCREAVQTTITAPEIHHLVVPRTLRVWAPVSRGLEVHVNEE